MGSRFSDRAAFVAGGAIGLFGIMLHCLVEYNMHVVANAVTAVILMALLASQARFATERYWENPGRIGKILLTGMAAGLMGLLSVEGMHKGAETHWLARSKAGNLEPREVAALQAKAIEAEPMDWETVYALGDYLWRCSVQDDANAVDFARQAMTWYAKAMSLNRFDAYAPVGIGMCLDRMGRTCEAAPYFDLAHRNDPHSCYIALEESRHSIELGDLRAARRWMDDAVRIAKSAVADAEEQKLERMLHNPLYMPPK
jgi:tetratricopeptide (TPR) repeat protein